MNLEKLSVVFDTNSYRNLVKDISIDDIEASIVKLKEKEASKNIMALASPVVGLELLGNLSGPGKSLHYDDCLKGLIAMANHCLVESENSIHIAPHSYVHIASNFFDVVPKDAELISKNMAGVIGDFKVDYVKAVEGHQLKGTFTKLKVYIDIEESRWIGEIESIVELARRELLKLEPLIKPKDLRNKMLQFIDSGLFLPRISMAIVFSLAKSLQTNMTDYEHVTKGSMLPRIFPLSVGFYQWICHRIVADNIDLRNEKSRKTRWNWRWDYEISFLINDHMLNGRKVMLITSDKEIIKVLQNHGYGGRVMNIDDYLRFLDT